MNTSPNKTQTPSHNTFGILPTPQNNIFNDVPELVKTQSQIPQIKTFSELPVMDYSSLQFPPELSLNNFPVSQLSSKQHQLIDSLPASSPIVENMHKLRNEKTKEETVDALKKIIENSYPMDTQRVNKSLRDIPEDNLFSSTLTF